VSVFADNLQGDLQHPNLRSKILKKGIQQRPTEWPSTGPQMVYVYPTTWFQWAHLLQKSPALVVHVWLTHKWQSLSWCWIRTRIMWSQWVLTTVVIHSKGTLVIVSNSDLKVCVICCTDVAAETLEMNCNFFRKQTIF